MDRRLERALAAQRESRRVAFRATFDPASDDEWRSLIRDVVAIANSGGGAILISSPALDRAALGDRLPDSVNVDLVEAQKGSTNVMAMLVDEAETPIVFDRGVLYVRHGAKTEPATNDDIALMIERRVNATRRSWLNAVRSVVRTPAGANNALPREVRDSDSPHATPIRVVDDPRAPAFRVVDPDKTHPYRQKEVLAALHRQFPDRRINQFDMQAIRHVYDIDAMQEFSHKSLFGTRQYSQKFVDWLIEQATREPRFFENARQKFAPRRVNDVPPPE